MGCRGGSALSTSAAREGRGRSPGVVDLLSVDNDAACCGKSRRGGYGDYQNGVRECCGKVRRCINGERPASEIRSDAASRIIWVSVVLQNILSSPFSHIQRLRGLRVIRSGQAAGVDERNKHHAHERHDNDDEYSGDQRDASRVA